MIVKGHDDLRQELLAMQVINKAHEIFKENSLNLYLRPYDILVISCNSGLLECVPDSISIDSLKKSNKKYRNLNEFYHIVFEELFEEAQKNFAESMAGYSLICYLLNIKDRHNGNILIDSDGHVIHIDFGFYLTNSPGGNVQFENAPFKLTREMIDIMGGYNSEILTYFTVLMYQGLIALRRYAPELLLLIEMMRPGEKLQCFKNPDKAVRDFRSKLHLDKSDLECFTLIEHLIKMAAENWKTVLYDTFQKLANGITP